MFERAFSELGPWNWMVLGFALLALEIVVPGVFLVWIGLAAIVVGLLSMAIWDLSFWTWQTQMLVFLVLALLSAWGGYRFVRSRETPSDQPLLNRRAQSLIGRTATLDEPIREGRGRIRVGDTVWLARGPDAAAGARVRVIAADDSELTVDLIEAPD